MKLASIKGTMRLLWALPFILLVGCNTPQIPLPPPQVETFPVTVDANNEQISFSGTVPLTGGQFFIIDRETGNGIIRPIDASGYFETGLFPARDGQLFDMRYTDGHDSSDVACVQVLYLHPDTNAPGLQRRKDCN